LLARSHSADVKVLSAASLKTQKDMLELIQQGQAMIRASDPWQYQTIQAMTQGPVYDEPYDPSPEAEARRLAERDNSTDEMEGELNAAERAALSDVFPGI